METPKVILMFFMNCFQFWLLGFFRPSDALLSLSLKAKNVQGLTIKEVAPE